MDMDSDLSEYLSDFYGDILRAEANLQYFAHASTTIDDILSRESLVTLRAKSLGHDFAVVLETIGKLRIILRNFNNDVEMVFENFDVGPSGTTTTTTANVNAETGALATTVPPMISSESESESDEESLPPAPESYTFPSQPPSISHRISVESVYSFTSDVDNYRCGVFGTCEITHIIDAVECICCMVDFERNVSSELVERWLSESTPMADGGLPPPNEIFGIEINSQIVRATCERQLDEIDTTAVPLRLIDIGEVIHVQSLSDHKMYNLTQEAKLTPIRANLCKIVKIGSKYTNDTPLDGAIMKRKFNFKVTDVCAAKRMLTVELFLTNPFVGEFNDVLTEDQLQQLHQRPSSLSTIGNENALTQNERMGSADIGSALSSSLSGNYDDNDITNTSCVTKIPRRPVHEQHQQPEQQQQQEPNRKALDSKIESLIENTISNANCDASNTERTNAKVNDEHRQRKDDDEIACDALRWRWNDIGNVEYDGYGDDNDNELAAGNTTNPTENGASQRNFSPNKKQRKIECDNIADDTHKLFAKSNDLVGGASVRAGATIADNNNRNTNNNHNANRYECIDALPLTMIQYVNSHHLRVFRKGNNVGDEITIIPTCIISAEQFYARLGEHYHSFSDFHAKLNAEFEANKLAQYSAMPDPLEMVLVLLWDGAVHRARVLNNSPATRNRIEVFCLDSGSTRFASLDNIFHWSPLCCSIPFQAILCNVVNVRSRRENDAEAIEFMCKTLLHRPVLAEVKELNTCGLMVRILYDDGFDIADELLARNLATRRHRIDHEAEMGNRNH